MLVKCFNNHGSENFTSDKDYIGTVTSEGLQVIDDKGEDHIIAKSTPAFNQSFEHDDWFQSRFIILDYKFPVM